MLEEIIDHKEECLTVAWIDGSETHAAKVSPIFVTRGWPWSARLCLYRFDPVVLPPGEIVTGIRLIAGNPADSRPARFGFRRRFVGRIRKLLGKNP